MKNVSPVPAHSTLCADGAMASAPIACAGSLSNTARQCTPASSVFQIPPDAAPMYATSGFPGSPTAAIARFPSGPTKRKCRRVHSVVSTCCAAAQMGAVARKSATQSLDTRTGQTAGGSKAIIDRLVCSVGLWVRERRGVARQGTLTGGLQIRKCARSYRREQRRPVRAALFTIHGCDRHAEDGGLHLADERAL